MTIIQEIPRTMSQYVVDVLRNEILTNQIPAGTRLRQVEISKRLGVSATPVREALKLLTAEGLIHFDIHKGAFAKNLTCEELTEIYELRLLLEEKLIRKSFPTITEENINNAINIQKKIEDCNDMQEWTKLNGLFHSAFWTQQANTHLYKIVENLTMAACPYVALSFRYLPSHISVSNITHSAIIDAFKTRNLQIILEIHENHLKDTQDILKMAFEHKKSHE